MNKNGDGLGNNPFVVNVVTYTGHGITFNDEAIALIPEYEDITSKSNGKNKVLRFINLSHWARQLATTKNTLNIFILSMCRNEETNASIE